MTRIFAWVLPLLAVSGCLVTDDGYYDDDYYYYDDGYYYGDGSSDYSCGETDRGLIDVGMPLESPPGEAVGVFVEYEGSGRWHVFTTCDTESSEVPCDFDIFATPLDAPVIGVAPDDLERRDQLVVEGADGVHLVASTGLDSDGFYLDTEPGAVLSLDVVLDRQCGNAFVYWIGDGGIHRGAPSNPFELEPAAP